MTVSCVCGAPSTCLFFCDASSARPYPRRRNSVDLRRLYWHMFSAASGAIARLSRQCSDADVRKQFQCADLAAAPDELSKPLGGARPCHSTLYHRRTEPRRWPPWLKPVACEWDALSRILSAARRSRESSTRRVSRGGDVRSLRAIERNCSYPRRRQRRRRRRVAFDNRLRANHRRRERRDARAIHH